MDAKTCFLGPTQPVRQHCSRQHVERVWQQTARGIQGYRNVEYSPQPGAPLKRGPADLNDRDSQYVFCISRGSLRVQMGIFSNVSLSRSIVLRCHGGSMEPRGGWPL